LRKYIIDAIDLDVEDYDLIKIDENNFIHISKCEKLHVFRREKTKEEILWYIKEAVQSDVKLMTRLRSRWQEDCDLHRFLIEFIMHVISNQEQDAQSIIQEINRHVLDVEFKEMLIDLAVKVQGNYNKLVMCMNSEEMPLLTEVN